VKNFVVSFLAIVVMITLLASCVSLEDRQMTWQERSDGAILGTVSASFTSFQWFHVRNEERLKRRAHTELTVLARQQFPGNVEIRNITISGGFSGWGFAAPLLAGTITGLLDYSMYEGSFVEGFGQGLVILGFPSLLFGNFQRITVTGDVVLLDTSPVEAAVLNASRILINNMPQGANVAILNVQSEDVPLVETIMAQLEYRLFASGQFTLVSRIPLDRIRQEQNLHISSEVDDLSAVFIGNLLGANIVITGSTGRDATGEWLLLRALDVTTTQIVAMAMGRF